MVNDFYDQLSPFYHLIYKDWEADIAQQAKALSQVIYGQWGRNAKSVLDVSCSIGTQSIGLAALGFRVTGSDLSPEAVERAKREAASRSLSMSFTVCDCGKSENVMATTTTSFCRGTTPFPIS